MSLLKQFSWALVLSILLCVTILADEAGDKPNEDASKDEIPVSADDEATSEDAKPMLVKLKNVLRRIKHNIADHPPDTDESITDQISNHQHDVKLEGSEASSKSKKSPQIRPQSILTRVEVATFEKSNPLELQEKKEKPQIEELNESSKKTPELPPFIRSKEDLKVSEKDSPSADDHLINFVISEPISDSSLKEKEPPVDDTIASLDTPLLDTKDSVVEKESSEKPDLLEEKPPVVTDILEELLPVELSEPPKKKDQARAEDDVLETYSQFAQRLSAQKKNGDPGTQPSVNQNKGAPAKVKSKNYASQECGAKLMASNPESKYADKIIEPSKDAYLLNECSQVTWVIIELCDAIRPHKFSIANFELFSNQPREIRVHASYRFPTREWHLLGTYEGEERNREIQSFAVETNEFVKYIKVEVVSHYGREFFCPLSLIQLHGVSEYEVIDHLDYDTDLAPELEPTTVPPPNKMPWDLTMLLRSVLGLTRRGSVPDNSTTELQEQSHFTDTCRSLTSSFAIQKGECTIEESLNYILSCYGNEYKSLVDQDFMKASLTNETCQLLAHNLCSGQPVPDKFIYQTICSNHYPCTMLSPKHVLAMCHILRPNFIRHLTLCNTDSIVSIGNDISMYLNSSAQNASLPAVTASVDLEVISEPKDTKESVITPPPNALEVVVTSNSTMEPVPNKTKTVESVKSKPEINSSHSASVAKEIEETNLHMESKVSPPNKETIIVRLSNKIKMLDHNMSISNQYLEELSRRYKQQMEDLQRQINETSLSIDKTTQLVRTYHLNASRRMDTIENKLDSLAETVEKLVLDKEDMMDRLLTHHLGFFIIQVVFLSMVFMCCSRRTQCRHGPTPPVVPRRKISADNSEFIRHRKRRPSDCSLTLSGNYQYLLREHPSPQQSPVIHRTAETPNRQDSHQSSTLLASPPGIELSESTDKISGVQQFIDEHKVPYYGTMLDGKFYEFTNSSNVETLTGNYRTDFNGPVINDYYEQMSEREETPWISGDSIPPSPVPIANPLGSQNLLNHTDSWQWYSRQESPLPPVVPESRKPDVVDSVAPVSVRRPEPEKTKKRKKKKKQNVAGTS